MQSTTSTSSVAVPSVPIPDVETALLFTVVFLVSVGVLIYLFNRRG